MPKLRVFLLSTALLLFPGGLGLLAQEGVVSVPETNGPPVLVDGTFSPGEWDDALSIPAWDGVTLYLKQEKGHVYVGIHCPDLMAPITDLFIEPAEGEIHQLHVSAQLGEIVLPAEGEEAPPWVWGHSPQWYANEVRWDAGERRRLIETGMDEGRAQVVSMFPYDGFEFQIRREKFGAGEWRIRLEVPSAAEYDTPPAFPVGTSRHNSGGWLVLNLG